MGSAYPWRDGRTVTEVIKQHRELLERVEILAPGAGYSVDEIVRFEERTGRAFPAEAREFYLAARPLRVSSERWPSIGFFVLDDPDVRWYALMREQPHPLNIIFPPQDGEFAKFFKDDPMVKDWRSAEGFMLGGNPFFERLFWVKGYRPQPPGCVMLTDHECRFGVSLAIAARSLAEYLGRLCFCGGIEVTTYPGDEKMIPGDKFRMVAMELAELNPGADYRKPMRN